MACACPVCHRCEGCKDDCSWNLVFPDNDPKNDLRFEILTMHIDKVVLAIYLNEVYLNGGLYDQKTVVNKILQQNLKFVQSGEYVGGRSPEEVARIIHQLLAPVDLGIDDLDIGSDLDTDDDNFKAGGDVGVSGCGVDDGSLVGILLGGVRSGGSSSGSGSSGDVDPKHHRRRRSRDAVIVGGGGGDASGGGGDFGSDGIGGAIVRGGDFGSDEIGGAIVRGGDFGSDGIGGVIVRGGDGSPIPSPPPPRTITPSIPSLPKSPPRTIAPPIPSLPKSPPPPPTITASRLRRCLRCFGSTSLELPVSLPPLLTPPNKFPTGLPSSAPQNSNITSFKVIIIGIDPMSKSSMP
ncbi:hypothetical protein Tco_0662417 [Tanacetum coccineum]